MKRTLAFEALVVLMALSGYASASDEAPSGKENEIQGRWLTESGNLEVEIAPCEQRLCGTVVRVLGNRSMLDPNAAMEPVDTRPALGMKILTDFTPSADGEWEGQIYNRENGKTYSCVMALASPDQLKIHGYRGIRLFGKTQVWRRVSAKRSDIASTPVQTRGNAHAGKHDPVNLYDHAPWALTCCP